jgi:hypothetical protein
MAQKRCDDEQKTIIRGLSLRMSLTGYHWPCVRVKKMVFCVWAPPPVIWTDRTFNKRIRFLPFWSKQTNNKKQINKQPTKCTYIACAIKPELKCSLPRDLERIGSCHVSKHSCIIDACPVIHRRSVGRCSASCKLGCNARRNNGWQEEQQHRTEELQNCGCNVRKHNADNQKIVFMLYDVIHSTCRSRCWLGPK